MKIGKIPGEQLRKIVLDKLSFRRDDVLVHAGLGEDCAVVDLENNLLVISTDPITGADKNSGYLAVHIACNDIAAAGAEPIGIQVVLLLPPTSTKGFIARLMDEINITASSLGVEVIGGHTEILSAVNKPIISVTAVGKVARDNYITSAGAQTGNDLVVTKGVGIEGTYVLANDYDKYLLKMGISEDILASAKGYGRMISVLKEGLISAQLGATAMHDITEGGLYGALKELSAASGVGFTVNYDTFPVREETKIICNTLNIEPAGLISSGSMLIAIPKGKMLVEKLAEEGIYASVIGTITREGRSIIKNGVVTNFSWSEKDELWRLMENFPVFS